MRGTEARFRSYFRDLASCWDVRSVVDLTLQMSGVAHRPRESRAFCSTGPPRLTDLDMMCFS